MKENTDRKTKKRKRKKNQLDQVPIYKTSQVGR